MVAPRESSKENPLLVLRETGAPTAKASALVLVLTLALAEGDREALEVFEFFLLLADPSFVELEPGTSKALLFEDGNSVSGVPIAVTGADEVP